MVIVKLHGEHLQRPAGYAQPVFPPRARLGEQRNMARYPLLSMKVSC